MGSNPAGEAKANDPQPGVVCFMLLWKGFEPCPEVNEAPVGPQSRALSEPAGEYSNPAGEAKANDPQPGVVCFMLLWKGFEPCPEVNEAPVGPQSRALSEPAGEYPNPAGEAKASDPQPGVVCFMLLAGVRY